MRRRDAVLLSVVVSLWIPLFGVQLHHTMRARLASSSLIVSGPDDATGHPTIRTVRSSTEEDLQVGDRVIDLDGLDLAGVGPIRFIVLAQSRPLERPEYSLTLPMQIERDDQVLHRELELNVRPAWPAWHDLFIALVYMLCGLTVLVRASRLPEAVMMGWALTTYSFHFLVVPAAVESESLVIARFLLGALSAIVIPPVCVRAASVSPPEAPPIPLRAIRWRWVFFLFIPAAGSVDGVPLPPAVGQWMFISLAFCVVLACLVLTTVNYRASPPDGRRRVRWVLYGTYVAFVPVLLAYVAWAAGLRFPMMIELALLSVTLLPLSLLVAIVRSNLFDIDRLISATAAYSIVATVAVGLGLWLVPALASVLSSSTGLEDGYGQIGLSVVIAAVGVPVGRRLRPRVDDLFFPDRRGLERGFEQLLGRLGAVGDPKGMTSLVGDQLDALLQPESCVVYASAGTDFEPVFVRGRAVPPAFGTGSALVRMLEQRSTPLASDRFSRVDRIERLRPLDRAALVTLGAAAVVPVHRRGQLVAFLCLGPKKSRDMYVGTEMTLLTAVANAVSTQLDRLDDARVLQEARAMQEELRRYVPGAVARGIDSGRSLEATEQHVSVLFVDIRGYSAYSEHRRPQEIFSTVNRYTLTVSSVVEKFGGSVVEFNGDGMMAGFGAPQSLPDKERSAVEAGREILAAVQSIPGSGERQGAGGVSVGVGIATGPAFVGNIQAVDRMIWSALGHTTNLAARLQSLTRELDAAMVVDEATCRAAGEAASDLQLESAVPIRGLRTREDLFLLRIREARAA